MARENRDKLRTAKQFEALKPEAARYEVGDALRGGLRMIVYPKTDDAAPVRKSWIFRYRDKKKGKHFGLVLGAFPDLSLAAARAKADEYAAANANGKNPVVAAKEERDRMAKEDAERKAAQNDAFEKCWAIYDEEHLGPSLRASTYAVVKRIYDQILQPKFAGQRISEISQYQIRDELLKDVKNDRGPNTANRVHSILGHFFKFFEGRKDKNNRVILTISEMRVIKKPMTEKPRKRDLNDAEIRWLWKACDGEGMFGTLLQFLLLTATRRDEARCMVERELNLRSGDWTLPGDRTKNGLEFVVPMAPAAVELLKTLKRTKGKAGLIFTQDGEVAISALSKRKARVEKAMLKLAREEAKNRGDDPASIEIPNWRIHDLRRTARTRLAKLQIDSTVAERCINHVEQSGNKAAYDRHDYLEDKRDAFAKLADHIKAIVDDMPANIISLDTRRGAA